MNIEQLLAKLTKFSPKAEVDIIVHNQSEDFTIVWSEDSEGEIKKNRQRVSLYVDRLCQSDKEE